MNASTALVRLAERSVPTVGVIHLRGRLRERALDAAASMPRVWLEALEPRRMMSGDLASLSLNTSFGTGGYATLKSPRPGVQWVDITGFAPAADGSFYLAGDVNLSPDLDPENTTHLALAHIFANGQQDMGFGRNGSVILGSSRMPGFVDGSLLVQSDGKIIVTDSDCDNGYNFAVERLNSDGSPDPTFGTNGRFTTGDDGTYTVISNDGRAWLTPDGGVDLLAVQGYSDRTIGLVTIHLDAKGIPDPSYGFSGESFSSALPGVPGDTPYFNLALMDAYPTPDGGAVAYFDFSPVTSTYDNLDWSLKKVQVDPAGNIGSVQDVYDRGPGLESNNVLNQPDGGAIVNVGTNLVRVNANGSMDSAFSYAGGFTPTLGVGNAALQPDGKILLQVGDDQSWGVQRLNPDGTPDNTFAGGEPALLNSLDAPADAIAALPNGSILVPLYVSGGPDDGELRIAEVLSSGGTPDTFIEAQPTPSSNGDDALDNVPAAYASASQTATGLPATTGLFADDQKSILGSSSDNLFDT